MLYHSLRTLSLGLVVPAALAAPLAAQTQSSPPQPGPRSAPQPATQTDSARGSDPVHGEDAEIVVSAPFVRELDLLSGTSVLTGEELLRDLRPQIGDTLTRQPGVSATSFTPGASRPVLRGLQGARIAVLTDGIGALDVSNTSADHAVTIDPLTTDRIEVLRGPASLLYGSQAIGGAVNAFDRRIPRAVPEGGYHVDAIGSWSSAFDGPSIGAAVDLALSPQIAIHLDGSLRDTDDVRVGGFVLSPALRAEQLALAEEEEAEGELAEAAEAREFAALRGRVPNSATRTATFGAGAALINDGGSLGVSVGLYDTRYGIPARPGVGHAHAGEEGEGGEEGEEAPVSIDLRQWRADLRGEVKLGGPFEALRIRGGYADYTHTEFEGDEVGTVFGSEGFEGRLELVQADRGGWRGVVGLQGFTRTFRAVGAEAFVPPNQTDQYGLFALQELQLGALGVEFSARYERSELSSDSVRLGLEDDAAIAAVRRSFNAFSIAGGVSYALAPDIRIGLNLSRVERAPAPEELFSNGPHIATQAYELGDPALSKETSWGAEAFLRGRSGPASFQLGAYLNHFDGFIYEADTPVEVDELPLFRFLQGDARFYGVEGEVRYDLVQDGDRRVTLELVGDYTRATIADFGPVPRIPPLRLLGAVEGSSGALTARLEGEWVAEQERVAAFETPTDGFALVNASLAWHPFGRESETVILLSADNLFDVDARRHASFTKDFVPLPGRNITLTARFSL